MVQQCLCLSEHVILQWFSFIFGIKSKLFSLYVRSFMNRLGPADKLTDTLPTPAYCVSKVSCLCFFEMSWPLVSWTNFSIELEHCHFLWAFPDFSCMMFLLCVPIASLCPDQFTRTIFIFSSSRYCNPWGHKLRFLSTDPSYLVQPLAYNRCSINRMVRDAYKWHHCIDGVRKAGFYKRSRKHRSPVRKLVSEILYLVGCCLHGI